MDWNPMAKGGRCGIAVVLNSGCLALRTQPAHFSIPLSALGGRSQAPCPLETWLRACRKGEARFGVLIPPSPFGRVSSAPQDSFLLGSGRAEEVGEGSSLRVPGPLNLVSIALQEGHYYVFAGVLIGGLQHREASPSLPRPPWLSITGIFAWAQRSPL